MPGAHFQWLVVPASGALAGPLHQFQPDRFAVLEGHDTEDGGATISPVAPGPIRSVMLSWAIATLRRSPGRQGLHTPDRQPEGLRGSSPPARPRGCIRPGPVNRCPLSTIADAVFGIELGIGDGDAGAQDVPGLGPGAEMRCSVGTSRRLSRLGCSPRIVWSRVGV